MVPVDMDKVMRFCMVTTFYPPYNFGGDGIMVQRLADVLAGQGHRVDVIHCSDAYRSLAGREPNGVSEDHPNVTVYRLKSPFGILSPLATQQTGIPFFKSGAIRQILEQGYDVIHFHNITLIGGPGILRYGNAIKLYTIHDYWLLCPTHVLFKFNKNVCTKRNCFLCSLIYRRPYPWWRLSNSLRKALYNVDAFIAPSRFCKDFHRDAGLDIPIVHIPNFVPSGESNGPSASEAIDKTPGEPYFLYVGRLEKLKGLQTLIPLFLTYRKARLIIAGAGNYEPSLRRLARGDDNIQFVGYQSQQGLSGLYRRATALIVPSLCYEILSNVVIESFLRETPVIVRNRGGMPELIKESGAGFVYETDEQLVSAMDRLLMDRPHRDELGRRGYREYHREWTAEAYLERYFSLINSLERDRGDGGKEKQL